MDIIVIILLATLAVDLGLGIYILSANWRSRANQAFSAVLLCLAQWTLAILLGWINKDQAISLYFIRTAYFGPALGAGFYLYFSLIFPDRQRQIKTSAWWLIFLPAVLMAFFSQTPFVLKEVGRPAFLAAPSFGFGEAVYILFMIAYFSLAFRVSAKKFLQSSGRQRLQIFYVIFGMAVTVVVGGVTSLIIPLFFQIGSLASLAPAVALIMAGATAYALVKYNLLGLEDFLSRGLVFLGAISAVVGSFAFIAEGNFAYLVPFYVVSTNIILGLFVFFQNMKSNVNRAFGASAVSLGLWTLCVFVGGFLLEFESAFGWLKSAYLIGALLPVLFFYFVLIFPREEARFSPATRFLLFFPPLLFALLVPFDLVVKGVRPADWGNEVVAGPFYFFYSAYFMIYLGASFYKLFCKHQRSKGKDKTGIKYLFFGTFLTAAAAVAFNVVLPLLGNSNLWIYGPYSTVLVVGFTTYAMLKHRLMSIEVVIQRSAVYGMATVMIMAMYALAVIVSETFLRQVMGYSSLFVTAAAALLIAVIYQPMVRTMQNLADRLFFRGRYDYQRTLREISRKIASVIQLEELSRLIVSSFIDTMKVSEISFLLLGKEKEHFRSVSVGISRYKKIEIDVNSPIVVWLASTRDILLREEIADNPDLEAVRNEMDRLGIATWVPIVSKGELIGIIALGDKLSGDVFTTEDIGLLSTLASQTAVALDNARLYDEVVSMRDYSEKILQSMVSGMLTVDTRGRIVTYNYMAEKITGRKAAEVMGRTCDEVWGKRGMISNIVENTLKRGKYYVNFESTLASPERGLVPVSFSSTLLYDHLGKKMGALLSIQDISEVKELEGKVRRADKLSALATMAAGMAHEIKNPLSSMKVLSQLLPKKINDPEYRRKLGEIFPREINRIDRIVESLLGFARATALKFEKADIREIVEENLDYFKRQAGEADIEIVKEFTEVPEVEVDRNQISQVFSNLVLNAIQAMPDGGTLRVVVQPGKQVEDVVQNVEIAVSDSGHGISEEMAKKLFDPFFTTKYGGTGLGLTISHSIVDGHKGYIDVQSKPGRGTTFTVTLPSHQNEFLV